MRSYQLTRSKRKTVALYIRDGGAGRSPNGEQLAATPYLEVRAPLKMPLKAIEEFITSKEKWITDRLLKSQAQAEQLERFTLNYSSLLYYRGSQYLIHAKNGTRAGFDGERFFMPPSLTPEQIKLTCIEIYRKLAKEYLTERTHELAQKMRLEPKVIKITNARTRWGSCSSKKSINLSWRLIMSDDFVSDYVITHELAHLDELNHSKRFWAVVENALPDYRARQMKLKEFQHRLNTEDWK